MEAGAAAPDVVLLSRRQIAVRNVESNGSGLFQLVQPWAIFGAAPGLDRAVFEREPLIGNDQIDIEVDCVSKALAARAGAERAVEAEQPRLGLFKAELAGLASELLIE